MSFGFSHHFTQHSPSIFSFSVSFSSYFGSVPCCHCYCQCQHCLNSIRIVHRQLRTNGRNHDVYIHRLDYNVFQSFHAECQIIPFYEAKRNHSSEITKHPIATVKNNDSLSFSIVRQTPFHLIFSLRNIPRVRHFHHFNKTHSIMKFILSFPICMMDSLSHLNKSYLSVNINFPPSPVQCR